MSGATYLIAVIAVMTAATFLTRVTPFVLLRNMADHPLLLFLGRYTPPAIMTILVLYSLREINLTTAPFGAPELIASLITVPAGTTGIRSSVCMISPTYWSRAPRRPPG